MKTETIMQLLTFVGDHELCGMLWWRCDEENAPITFFVNCNDLFGWACGDCETITEENLPIFKKAVEDAVAADPVTGAIYGCELFVARVRELRPQGAAYPKDKALWPLFDACGPERELNAANPYKPGDYK